MKRCPNCQADYFDEMLEFCLEDGAKLSVAPSSATSARTQTLNTNQNNPVETMFFEASSEVPKTVKVDELAKGNLSLTDETKLTSLKQKAVEKGYRTLEIGTLVFALAHNWWQWLYVDRQTYGSVANFLFSVEFLIWFLTLSAGITFGLLTLKFSRKKELGYAGLIILAINFLLLIVPRK